MSSTDDASSAPLTHTKSDAANEALIADLLSPKQAEHDHVTSAATDAILAAGDTKPAHKKADSFYTTGLPDLAPQALSPVAGGSGADASSSAQFTFNSGK